VTDNAAGATSWTDYDDLSTITGRYYRVLRLNSSGDPDGDGLPNGSEAFWGTNPYNDDSDGDGILDGPYNNAAVPPALTNIFSSLSGVPGAYLANTNFWFALDPAIPTAAPFKTVNVETNIYSGSGDSTTEVFEVSSRGRILPYAAGANAASGFGRIDGGIYFNHDNDNLYIGVAGLAPRNDNALLIFLDTTGGLGGGVTNLANMGTLTQPYALTRTHNLFFDATNFTPNVGIIVGDKRRDGRNYASAVFVNNDFGQGVYRLHPTTVTDFPGFNQTGGCAISQWGDLQTVWPGDPADTNAAYAGVQIAIRKSDLGLTNAATFKAAAIIIGGTDGNNRFFSTEAYGKSVSGGFGFSATTLIGSLVYLDSRIAPAYAPVAVDDNAVMMQGFFWNVPNPSLCSEYAPGASSFYAELAGRADDIARAGFTSVWMPPPQKGKAGAFSAGYDPNDHYDLGQTAPTRYGSFAQLTNATAALYARGVAPYADIVINHMTGSTNLNANGPGYFTNNASGYFFKTPADFYATTDWSSPPFHLLTTFALDHYEVNQGAPHMRLALEAWGEWLTAKVGYQGYRFDHSLGIEPWFQAEWLEMPMMDGKFALMEYIGDVPATRRYLRTWLNLVDQRASLYDFMLHASLVNMCGNGSFNMASLTNAGLVAVAPEFAVSYVEDHDTIHPPCDCFTPSDSPENGLLGITANKMVAYSYVLMSPGYPMVHYHDYYYAPNRIAVTNCPSTFDQNYGFTGSPLKPRIDLLINARQKFAAGAATYLPQLQASPNPQDVYVSKRDGAGVKSGCILEINRTNTPVTVVINTGWPNTNVVDFAGNSASFTTDSSGVGTNTVLGRNYAVFVRQPQQAFDVANYPIYATNGWQSADNGGWGFGSWTLAASPATSGFFVGASTGNGGGSTPGIDTGGNAWGLYANSGSTSVAYRAFSPPLPVGSTFLLDTDNGFIQSGGAVGFAIRNGNEATGTSNYNANARLTFLYIGNDPVDSYKVVDASGQYDIGVPWRTTGLRLILRLVGSDEYILQVVDNATGNVVSEVSGTLAGSGSLDSVALFNINAGGGSGGDVFFNSMQIAP
jgi:alpha-amylase